MTTEKSKDLDYWKSNAEEDYITTPISVLKYITELEQQVKSVDLADVGDCCPACKSTNSSDNSTYENNGIIGSGFASWKTSDSRACNDCGCIFKPIKGN